MTNKEIAAAFDDLGSIMELHEEPFYRIRTYQNAYLTIRKLDRPLAEMSDAEIKSIKGFGDALTGRIRELLTKGKMAELERFREKTPAGVVEMLGISGFGPKKIRQLWQELGVETIGELAYACNENRLVELKGFGPKTQEDLRQKLEFFQRNRSKSLWAAMEIEAEYLLPALAGRLPEARVEATGELRRKSPVVERLEVLIGTDDADFEAKIFDGKLLELERKEGETWLARLPETRTPVSIFRCEKAEFGSKQFLRTAGEPFFDAFLKETSGLDFKNLDDEKAVFEKAGLEFMPPELRDNATFLPLSKAKNLPKLLEIEDIRGVVHAHSTWSDGTATVREMAEAAIEKGFAYLTMTDHSQAAFYANGLKPERLLAQIAEIDALNLELAPRGFRIFKGIESDILNDGSLDYEDEILAKLDLVIASVHSNLRMDRQKATERLIRAIENPRTTILGHPTGRLLLAREGYPIDHEKVIDACAANRVAIEMNANPYRLDMDFSWIPRAVEKGVLISVNPDAHSKKGISDIRFGVFAARKGGLSAQNCLNARDAAGFEQFLITRK